MPRTDSKRWLEMMATAISTAAWSPTIHAAPVPDRVWGTFVAGYQSASVPRVATDAAGNVYIAGRSFESGLATPGAHKEQPELGDAYLVKFDPAGERVWGTYFGGSGSEITVGLAVAGDTIAICGITDSLDGIASPGAFRESKGDMIGYVATFTLDGEWSWGTYIPSCGGFTGNGTPLAVGSDGTVDAGGRTGLDDPGLTTPGAHQDTLAGGEDAVLLRLGLQGELLWGTYYGGEKNDTIYGVARDDLGATYIVGRTASFTGIATPGAFQEAHATNGPGAEADAFVARFADGGVLDWGTYFGGTQTDMGHVVAAHPAGGIVFLGYSHSPGLATPGTHQQVFGGVNDALVARFDVDGERLWSTYFGGESSDVAYGLAIDVLGSTVISGRTGSTTGIATVNAYQVLPADNNDTYVGKLDEIGNLLWSTYYGGEKDEYEATVAIHGSRTYLAGRTFSTQSIATPDAFMPNPGGNFLAAFTEVAPGSCADSRDCGGGPCVDGMCCDTACGDGVDDCQACSVAMGGLLDGHCSPSAVGQPCADATGECDAPDVCTANSRLCQDADLPDDTPCSDGLCQGGLCTPPPEESTGTTADDTTGDQTTATASTSGIDTTGDLTMGMDSTIGDSAAETGSTTADAGSGDLSTGTGSTSASDPGTEATGTTTGDPPSSTAADPPTSSTAPDDAPTSAPATSGDSSSGSPIDDPADIGCACDVRPAAPVSLLFTTPLLLRRRRSTT